MKKIKFLTDADSLRLLAFLTGLSCLQHDPEACLAFTLVSAAARPSQGLGQGREGAPLVASRATSASDPCPLLEGPTRTKQRMWMGQWVGESELPPHVRSVLLAFSAELGRGHLV